MVTLQDQYFYCKFSNLVELVVHVIFSLWPITMIVIGNKEGDADELMKANEKARMISQKDVQELKNSIIYLIYI